MKNREMDDRTELRTTQRERVALSLLDERHLHLAEAWCHTAGTILDTLSTLRTLTSTKYEYTPEYSPPDGARAEYSEYSE